MDSKQSVVARKDYGSIVYHFREVMDAKGISRNELARRADFRFEVANRFYNGAILRMDIDVLVRVCFVLDCEVGDVMEYRRP